MKITAIDTLRLTVPSVPARTAPRRPSWAQELEIPEEWLTPFVGE